MRILEIVTIITTIYRPSAYISESKEFISWSVLIVTIEGAIKIFSF